MIIKDRLLLKYGSSLSSSILEEELKKLNIIFSPIMYEPKTHSAVMSLLYRNEKMSFPVILIGHIYSNSKSFDDQDVLEISKQVENVLFDSIKDNSYLAHDIKLLLVKERFEQNKK